MTETTSVTTVGPPSGDEALAHLYLDLLKRSLAGLINHDPGIVADFVDPQPFDYERRRVGEDWPVTAGTMIGMDRLDNLQACVPDLLQHGRFHRGGFSTTNPRVLATVTYSSPASLASLTERSYEFAGSLDELARRAHAVRAPLIAGGL